MPTKVSAPLPELDWPTLTVIQVDAGNGGGIVESLIVLVSEDAADAIKKIELLPPLLVHEPLNTIGGPH